MVRFTVGGFDEYSHQVREDDAILERTGHPDQIQRILIDADLARQAAGVVAAQERASVWVDADAKISHPHFQLCLADDVRYGCGDSWVDLCGIKGRWVTLVVKGYEEYVGNAR